MPITKIVGGVIADTTITSTDILDSTITNAKLAVDPANASNLSSGDVPLAQLGNVPAADLSPQQNDIATLALHSAVANNLAAYNLANSFVDQFEDSTGLDVLTDVERAAGEYMTSILPAEGNDSYTKFLVNSNTTNGSTVFTDTSVGGSTHTITAGGNVQNVTNYAKFGTSSIYFDGSGDQLTIPNPSWSWRDTDWTVDCWVRGTSGWGGNFWNQSDTGGYPKMRTAPGGTLDLYYNQWADVNTNQSIQTTGNTLTEDAWHHVAWVMGDGTDGVVYIDGLNKGSTTFNTMNTMSGGPFRIGNEDYEGGQWYTGWIDEFRVSIGIERWTANFTPPTAAYSAESINAAGNWTSTTETAAATVSKMSIVVLYKNAYGTATLDTDLIAQVSSDGGSNYVSAPLTAAGTFSTGILIAKSNDITISNTGTAPKYKISLANQAQSSKETQVHGVSMIY